MPLLYNHLLLAGQGDVQQGFYTFFSPSLALPCLTDLQ